MPLIRRLSTLDVNIPTIISFKVWKCPIKSKIKSKSHPIQPFKDQNYNDLKSMYDEENLFEDPYFPASDESLYHNEMPPQGIRWLRPKVSWLHKYLKLTSIKFKVKYQGGKRRSEIRNWRLWSMRYGPRLLGKLLVLIN